jgi:CheY-like chemotaxis protein
MPDRLDSDRSFRPRPQAPRRILVVGSNVDAVENLVLLLRGMGHDVEFSVNAEEALDTARSFLPQFVFLDLAPSRKTGCEAARRLRREPGLEGMRLIALISDGKHYDPRWAREAGCELHLTKPVDPAFLAGLLAQGPPLEHA